MTAITHALNAALLHSVWQGLAVMILFWLALWTLRRRSAATRYAVSCAALVILVALPVVTTCLLYEPPLVTAVRSETFRLAVAATPVAVKARFDWLLLVQSWAVPVWSCGVLLFSVRMAWGCARVAALRRSGELASGQLRGTVAALADRMGLTRPVRVLLSNVMDSPSVTGWIRPVLFLPVCAIAGLTPEQLEAVIAHELAHVRRHDYLVNLLQMVAEAVLFYHPAVWWISARIRQERELCCDDLAVEASGGALSYARALTALEKMRTVRPVLVLGATDGPLFYRVRRLVTGGAADGPSKSWGVVALMLGFACFALSVHWARGQQPAQSVREPVVIEATVDSSGQVIDARVLSGPAQLRKPALISVLDRRFSPGNGTRTVQIPFEPPAPEVQADEQALADQLAREVERQNRAVQVLNDSAAVALKRATSDNLRRHLGELRAQQAAAQNAFMAATKQQREIERVQGELASLMAQLSAGIDGPLRAVEIHDLSDDAKRDLLSRMPVHEGDALTTQSIEAMEQAIKQFDERLVFSFDRTADGLVLRIYRSKDLR